MMEALIRIVDELEARAGAGYVTLADVETASGGDASAAIADQVLLVDHRLRLDANTGNVTAVTLCRLNRHHAMVKHLTGW
jgi:hypothetical protein